MRWVLVALVPGVLFQCYWFGLQTLANIVLAAAFGLATEAALVRLREPSAWPALRDCSALVTSLLIALALPPSISWQILAVACVTGLALGKHAYGGTGRNLFNPAMVGYAVVLVSFPGDLVWPIVDATLVDASFAGDSLTDARTGPTLLEAFKHRGALTVAEAWQPGTTFGTVGGTGIEWLNLGYLVGGILLLQRRIVDWRMPCAMLASMALIALAGYDSGSSDSLGTPMMHWFSGSTMLGAWFVATDPVTCPASGRGRLLFGALIGALVMIIRTWGGYPDGIAFAVLLANAAAPTFDRYLGSRKRLPGAVA